MNKYDVGLLISIMLLVLGLWLFLYNNNNPKKAVIKYDGKVKEEITLGKSNVREFTVMGDKGIVVIEVQDKQARVVEETSPRNICSEIGWRSDIIICLPNRVVIEMIDDETVDTVVR